MAIKLAASATLNDTFEYISPRDEAMDTERKGFTEEFDRYRHGLAEPPLKEGVEPTVFVLRPVSVDAGLAAKLDGVCEKDGRSMWSLTAAALGIVGWRNLEDPDTGEPLEHETVRAQGYDALTKPLQDKLTKPLLVELGQVILLHNNPSLS